MNLIHDLLDNNYVAWEVGKYAGIGLMLAAYKLRPHLPHRHTGYVSVSGWVHACSTCGRAPKTLQRDLREVVARAATTPWVWPLSPQATIVARTMGVTPPGADLPAAWQQGARELADDVSEYRARHPVAAKVLSIHDASGFWTAE